MGDVIRTVIAGGGFAGLHASIYLGKTLERRLEIEVVLISRENFISDGQLESNPLGWKTRISWKWVVREWAG